MNSWVKFAQATERTAAKEVYKEVGDGREEEREVNREVCEEGGKKRERNRGGISQNGEEKGQTGRRCPLGSEPIDNKSSKHPKESSVQLFCA